ncbi:MAG: hypothetical protein AAF446_08000 [Pseudomonadota bacterium]
MAISSLTSIGQTITPTLLLAGLIGPIGIPFMLMQKRVDASDNIQL